MDFSFLKWDQPCNVLVYVDERYSEDDPSKKTAQTLPPEEASNLTCSKRISSWAQQRIDQEENQGEFPGFPMAEKSIESEW